MEQGEDRRIEEEVHTPFIAIGTIKPPDASKLAALLLEWETKRRELDTLEKTIEEAVLLLKKTQNVGNVRATYSKGKATYAYESAGAQAPPEIIARHTIITEKTDWKSVCEEAGIKDILATYGEPKVTLKLVE